MLVSVETAACQLALSSATVRAAIRRGAIPAVHLGRRVLIAQETLDALERLGHPTLTRR